MISSFKSSSIEDDVHLVKMDHKVGCALGRGYLVIDRSLPETYTSSLRPHVHDDIVTAATFIPTGCMCQPDI